MTPASSARRTAWMRFFLRADAFLSLADRDLDIETRRRARLLNWGGALMALLLALWLVSQCLYGAWPLAAWQAGLLLATIGILWALRRTSHFGWCAHLLCLVMMGAVHSGTAYSGGLTAANLSLMLVVPVCAVVLAGLGGLWWTLAVLAGVSGFAYVETHLGAFPYLTPPEWQPLDSALTWLTAFAGITLVFAYNHAACTRAEREQAAALAEARGASESKTRFLASLNREIREPLHHILGLLVLMKDESSAQRRRELGEEARRIGQALSAGVEGILRLARDEHLLEIQRARLDGEKGWSSAGRAADGRRRDPAQPQDPPGRATGPRRVLVAEDEPVGRRLLARILADLGCQVTETGDGQAALEALQRQTFDLALVDCRLPALDGLALARELRRREAASGAHRLALFGMSAESGEEQAAACREAGMDGFLPKPFGRREIEALLNRAGQEARRG